MLLIVACLAVMGCGRSGSADAYILDERPDEGVSIVYEVSFPPQADPAKQMQKAIEAIQDVAYLSGYPWYVTSAAWNQIEIVIPISAIDTEAQQQVVHLTSALVEQGRLSFHVLVEDKMPDLTEAEVDQWKQALYEHGPAWDHEQPDCIWFVLDNVQEQWDIPRDQTNNYMPEAVADYLFASRGWIAESYNDEVCILVGNRPAVSTRSGPDSWQIKYVEKARDNYGNPAVFIELDKTGAEVFKRITTDLVGRFMAIVVNDRIIMAPKIISAMPDGQIQIAGNLTPQDVNRLLIALTPKDYPVVIEGPPVGITVFESVQVTDPNQAPKP